MGGGGMVQAGPDEKETLYVRRGGGWKEVGHGARGSVALLAGNRALYWVTSPTGPSLVVTPDGAARPVSQVFPCTGLPTISPDGAFVDCGACARGGLLACDTVALERRTSDGASAGAATIEASPGCRFRWPAASWYDAQSRSYVLGECPDGSRTLFRTDFAGAIERFPSARPIDDAKSWSLLAGRVALSGPKSFERLNERPTRSVRR